MFLHSSPFCVSDNGDITVDYLPIKAHRKVKVVVSFERKHHKVKDDIEFVADFILEKH